MSDPIPPQTAQPVVVNVQQSRSSLPEKSAGTALILTIIGFFGLAGLQTLLPGQDRPRRPLVVHS